MGKEKKMCGLWEVLGREEHAALLLYIERRGRGGDIQDQLHPMYKQGRIRKRRKTKFGNT